jgi:MerR family copper efflux transcriptional regulator
MKIHELSVRTGVSQKTIRYYESIDVLPMASRQPNGYRMYTEQDATRLQLVNGARRLGLSLNDIKEVIALRDRGEAPCTVLLAQLMHKADEVAQRIIELSTLETELRQLHALGLTFPTDDVEGKACVCHLVSENR